jgi:hypothetical protein
MKKIIGLLLALCMLLSGVAFAETAEVEVPALQQNLVILFTSDVHCGVESGFGYEGLAMIRDNLKAQGNHVLLVDNGDSIQGEPMGTMTTGEANIKLMNAVGYDIATIGNHEFDYGMTRFFELVEMAEFPYISCNFVKDGAPVFAPYIIKEFDGVKVAFVGISTPKTITSSAPKYFQDDAGNFIYGFCQDETGAELYTAVQSAVDAARAEGIYPIVGEGYRTAEEQQKILDDKIQAYINEGYSRARAEKTAKEWVALPGTSEHQLGIAVDINADKSKCSNDKVYEWLAENAYKYGFILRYPAGKQEITGTSYEPWHYRYVGVEAAREIYERQICLEEYFE